jgi:hypothetical protein
VLAWVAADELPHALVLAGFASGVDQLFGLHGEDFDRQPPADRRSRLEISAGGGRRQ